jgi:hypothetical protein
MAFAAGCSSSSPGAPFVLPSEDASTGGGGDGSQGSPPQDAAAPAEMCDAVSLAPVVDAAAAGCFECQAMHCMTQVAACSTDCTCAPNYRCLEEKAAEGALSSGYSLCTGAIDALMNGNAALMDVAGCATTNCNAECFGGGGGSGG